MSSVAPIATDIKGSQFCENKPTEAYLTKWLPSEVLQQICSCFQNSDEINNLRLVNKKIYALTSYADYWKTLSSQKDFEPIKFITPLNDSEQKVELLSPFDSYLSNRMRISSIEKKWQLEFTNETKIGRASCRERV